MKHIFKIFLLFLPCNQSLGMEQIQPVWQMTYEEQACDAYPVMVYMTLYAGLICVGLRSDRFQKLAKKFYSQQHPTKPMADVQQEMQEQLVFKKNIGAPFFGLFATFFLYRALYGWYVCAN